VAVAWRSRGQAAIFSARASQGVDPVRHAQIHTRLVLVGIFLLVAVAGCQSTGGRHVPADRAEAFVRVENRSMLDMTIYVVRGGERRRLGLVNALTTQMLSIPSVLINGSGVLRFLADPIGGSRTPVSEEVFVRDGDVVQLIIPPQ
jgi:hypothetical protein